MSYESSTNDAIVSIVVADVNHTVLTHHWPHNMGVAQATVHPCLIVCVAEKIEIPISRVLILTCMNKKIIFFL